MAPRCEALPGWRYERIELPPEFAPELPPGTEVLWFSPGMFDPEADDYFTYAFSLDVEGGALEPATIDSLLLQYYRGLMHAVASSRDAAPQHEAVVTMTAPGKEATIELSDEFTTGETITLHLRMSTAAGSDCLRVLATARPTEVNWAELGKSHTCLCERSP